MNGILIEEMTKLRAGRATEESRKYNTKRLEARGKAKDLQPGDMVVALAQERAPLDSKWDHPYMVTRMQGPVVTIQNERTGKLRTVNRGKLQLINSDALWDDERPRVTRAGRKRLLIKGAIKDQSTSADGGPPAERDTVVQPGPGINADPPTVPVTSARPLPANNILTRTAANSPDYLGEGAVGGTDSARPSKRSGGVVTRSQAKRARDDFLPPLLLGKRPITDEEQKEAKRQCIALVSLYCS